MKIKLIVIDFAIEGKETWENQYPSYYNDKFRVCDFALLIFNEIIKPLGIKDWMDIDERDAMIK